MNLETFFLQILFDKYQGMTCDVRQQVASCDVQQQVAMCGCEPTFWKLTMCVCVVHFQTCEVRSQLCTFLGNHARYEDKNALSFGVNYNFVDQKLKIFSN